MSDRGGTTSERTAEGNKLGSDGDVGGGNERLRVDAFTNTH